MKSIPLYCLFAAAMALQATATDFIRQIHIFNDDPGAPPIIRDVPVSSSSGQIVSDAIVGDGSLFQLYGMGPNPFNAIVPHLLDEKVIGAYYPQAEITIVSEDNHHPPRTRADRPYQLQFKVKGMASDPVAPSYARLTVLEQGFKSYDPATNVPFANGSMQGVYPGAFIFESNGEWVEPATYQDLPGADAVKVRGEETFTFLAYPDESMPEADRSWMQLAAATIQIWPVSEARIIGLLSNKRYTVAPTSVRVELLDLYPRSITYVQVYPGPEALGTMGYILPATIISYNTFAPQAAMLTLDDLDNGLTVDGLYTIEVLTVTPFNNGEPERLAHQSFIVDRTIEVRSSVTTID